MNGSVLIQLYSGACDVLSSCLHTRHTITMDSAEDTTHETLSMRPPPQKVRHVGARASHGSIGAAAELRDDHRHVHVHAGDVVGAHVLVVVHCGLSSW